MSVGAVVIGRNEGERLRRCLASLAGRAAPIVYVDSGSSDGSVELARAMGAEVIELDGAAPYTAARARNAGIAALRGRAPRVRYAQVVDGDCEMHPDWIEAARAAIESRPRLAAVCGRRRERRRDATIWNRLCDLEWDTPVGLADACGGDALLDLRALEEVGGYRDAMIAGEEPELCARLRRRGWRVLRVDAEMTRHDADMTCAGQWWRRAVRAGHAYAEGWALHGRTPPHLAGRELRSIVLWGGLAPLAGAAGAVLLVASWTLLLRGHPAAGGPALLAALAMAGVLAGTALLWLRVHEHRRRRGASRGDAALYATACVAGKVPQLVGAATYLRRRLRGEAPTIIEYKAPRGIAPADAPASAPPLEKAA